MFLCIISRKSKRKKKLHFVSGYSMKNNGSILPTLKYSPYIFFFSKEIVLEIYLIENCIYIPYQFLFLPVVFL